MPALTNDEIDRIEQSMKLVLPGLYRTLLFRIGPGPLGPSHEIYHPSQVRELYEPFLENPRSLFNPYFPFGADNDTQELWIIDASKEVAASIFHETHPDDWPEEEWLEYDDWIMRYLEPLRGFTESTSE